MKNRKSWLSAILFAVCLLLLLLGVWYENHVTYQNSRFTIGTSKSVSFEDDLNFQYTVNKHIYVGGKVHESYRMEKKRRYMASVGKQYLVRFNYLQPSHAVIYLDCELPDSLNAPDTGWLHPPFNCASLNTSGNLWLR